jgi:hypothetical protein
VAHVKKKKKIKGAERLEFHIKNFKKFRENIGNCVEVQDK